MKAAIDRFFEPQNERVAILKKLREYLLRQRESLKRYLYMLKKEGEAIAKGDIEKLRAYVHFEHSIVSEITVLQKAIDPLEMLYRRACPQGEASIEKLRDSLTRLRENVLERNRRNRDVLSKRIEDLRGEIRHLSRRPRTSSPYAHIGVPTRVDISS